MADVCTFASFSSDVCGPRNQNDGLLLQTLDEIDASQKTLTMYNSNTESQASWTILSRVGINYLTGMNYYGKWVICQIHKKELLDSYDAQSHCCCGTDHDMGKIHFYKYICK